jgi:hypothetical protein
MATAARGTDFKRADLSVARCERGPAFFAAVLRININD